MTQIVESLPLIDDILGEWSEVVGGDLPGYRNHVYRMVNFAYAMGDLHDEQRKKVAVAGCFHDIGIWPQRTLDYLPPSAARAREYLAAKGLANWSGQIDTMICEHHKLRSFQGDPLVEVFRKGDLVDFSLGLLKCGLPASYIREVKAAFPNAGFHKCLVKIAGKWIARHPLNPVPVAKW